MNFSNFYCRSLFFTKNLKTSTLKDGRNFNKIYGLQFRNASSILANINQPIANSSIVRYSMDGLISLHEWSHMSWFTEITMVTIMAKALVTFPLTVLQRKILIRYERLKPEIQIISQNLRKRIKQEAYIIGLSQQKSQKMYAKMLTREINRLIQRDNCHPVKASLVVMFQIPMWIILSNCYRNLAKLFPNPNDPQILMAYEQLRQEGIFWFKDLTIPDSTGILPVVTCLINLTIIQMHVNERKRNKMKDSILIRIITNGGRAISLALIPIGLMMPANMCSYWFISSSMGLLQNILLVNPKVKNFLKLNFKVNSG